MPVKSPRLLIVDDDKGSQIVYQQLAKKYSFNVEIAHDGIEALRMYELAPQDFTHVIMDWRLPEMSGTDCARAMRHIQRTSKCFAPILCVTANAMPGDRELCLREGMDDYMSKPFSIGQFLDLLARWSAFENEAASTAKP
jgi:CheY-like chemotaxis protein